jgi:Ca-activated chloride channel homolog
MLFRNPQLLWLLLLLPTLVLVWVWRRGRVRGGALVLRALAVALLIIALADPSPGAEVVPEGPLVVLVDQSASLNDATRTQMLAEANQLAATNQNSTLLAFGGDVQLITQNRQAPDRQSPSSQSPNLQANATNLAEALRTARALLPGGGRVVLLSDGLQNEGDALVEAQIARANGIVVDVWPHGGATGAELSIVRVTAPRTLRAGEEFPIEIEVAHRADPAANGGAVSARLRLWEGDTLLNDEEVWVAPGSELFTVRHRAGLPGVLRLRAELTPSEDGFSENNGGGATALVAPPPRVLLVEGKPGASAEIGAALESEGVEIRAIGAQQIPIRLSELSDYDGMVLFDVPANDLSIDQMATLREFVRSEGRGLVALGGRNSYTLGGYKDTPLEQVLPVQMEPPPRPQRSDIALLLIVDRSASMTAALGVSKFAMAKEAAILATNSLQASDRIGILAFDTGQLWVVPFQQVGQGLSQAQIEEQIINLPSGGGTDIQIALTGGLPALAGQPSKVRHAVLLTDGRSFTNDMAAYEQLVETARAQEITLSTIAIGSDADLPLLEQLATWGGGRYYFAGEPEDIPRLTLLESEIARADPLVEEPFQADLAEVHPIMRDFAPAELPQLDGYVAVTPKDAAEVVLRSPDDDPVLVAWQYGLGRAVAWTPSAGEPFATGWPRWLSYGRFWAQVVRYTLPEPDSGPLQVRLEPRPGGARITVDALRPGGEPLDLATVNARMLLPDGSERDFAIRQVAPGRYSQELALPATGPYAVSVVLLRDGALQEAEMGYVQPVPAEFQILSADEATAGPTLLSRIAETTGGSVRESAAVTETNLPTATTTPAPPLWPWLVGAALTLFVVEIALRRGLFVW